jgi:hypothetical protein
MLNIPIDDKYVVTSDERNLILNIRKIVKNGKAAGEERLCAVSYHGNITSLFDNYLKVRLLESDCESFREVVGAVAEVKKIVADIQTQMSL